MWNALTMIYHFNIADRHVMLLCNLLFYIPQNRVGKADRPSRCGQPCPTCRQVPGCGPGVGQTEWYSYCDTVYKVKGAKKHLPAVNKSIFMFQIWAKVIKRITPKTNYPRLSFLWIYCSIFKNYCDLGCGFFTKWIFEKAY